MTLSMAFQCFLPGLLVNLHNNNLLLLIGFDFVSHTLSLLSNNNLERVEVS
jgi:hypothetical protein